MRKPAEITKGSAISIAKWRIGDMLKNDKLNMIQKYTMGAALADGGGVDQIGNILYDLGLKLSIDTENPVHKSWLESGAVEIDED